MSQETKFYGLECNGLLAFPIEKIKEFVDKTQAWSGETINLYRHFLYMPEEWTKNMPTQKAFFLCSRPAGSKPFIHMPALNKIANYGVHLGKYPGTDIQFPAIDRCAWSIIKSAGWIYAESTWNDFWKPLIKNMKRALSEEAGLPQNWEGCNESNVGWQWEVRLSEYLKNLGSCACSSPMRDFDLVRQRGKYDFLWLHGMWKKSKFQHDFYKYQGKANIGFSSDGLSDLRRWDIAPFDGMGMAFKQFNSNFYGHAAHYEHIRRCLLMLKKKGHHVMFNLSGEYEVKKDGKHHPRWEYIRKVCEIFKEILS